MDCARILSLYKLICENDPLNPSKKAAAVMISCDDNGKDCQYLRRLKNDCESEEAYTSILFPRKPRVIVKHLGHGNNT